MSREHELRLATTFFAAVASGVKTFEIRRDDRGFKVGDTLVLREWQVLREPAAYRTVDEHIRRSDELRNAYAVGGMYTGRQLRVRVTYLTNYEQRDGYVVMAIVQE